MNPSIQPIHLVSVNTTPQRAKELVAILIMRVQERHSLVHVANTEAIPGVTTLLTSLVLSPKLLICSSQWSAPQQEEILRIARTLVPEIKTIAIPPGLNAAKGGEAVVDFLEEQVLKLDLPKRI